MERSNVFRANPAFLDNSCSSILNIAHRMRAFNLTARYIYIHIYIVKNASERGRGGNEVCNDWWQETSDSHEFFIGRSIMTHLSARRAAHPRACHALLARVKRSQTRQAVHGLIVRFSFISLVMRFLRPRFPLRDVSSLAGIQDVVALVFAPCARVLVCRTPPVDQKVVCNRLNGSRCCCTRVWPPID